MLEDWWRQRDEGDEGLPTMVDFSGKHRYRRDAAVLLEIHEEKVKWMKK